MYFSTCIQYHLLLFLYFLMHICILLVYWCVLLFQIAKHLGLSSNSLFHGFYLEHHCFLLSLLNLSLQRGFCLSFYLTWHINYLLPFFKELSIKFNDLLLVLCIVLHYLLCLRTYLLQAILQLCNWIRELLDECVFLSTLHLENFMLVK